MAQNPFVMDVYKEGKELAKEVFQITKDFKHFRLRDQYFGAASSIPANLAELGAFDNRNQILQKIRVCIGEANECEFWTDLCGELGLIDPAKHKEIRNKTKKLRMMLYNFLKVAKYAC